MDTIHPPQRSTAELWQDYYFLTNEMEKLILKQNVDLFLELMEQRQRLQPIIEKEPDNGFRVSPEGRALLKKIQNTEQAINMKLQFMRNKAGQQQKVSAAYDGLNGSIVGNFINSIR
ncbi:hypothetical protein SDC9_44033 [bioreactor metagenome]|uniref:Flagellar protein FliT n=1 Tax=bioreactor metagenome TaxID=1076179 RepID=A0A644W2N1_9ZZZZ